MGVEKVSMSRNGVIIEAGTTWKLEESRELERKTRFGRWKSQKD